MGRLIKKKSRQFILSEIILYRKNSEIFGVLQKHIFMTFDWPNWLYLVEGILKKQGKKLYNWKLRARLDPPQVNADKEAQEISELFQVTAGWKRKNKTLKQLKEFYNLKPYDQTTEQLCILGSVTPGIALNTLTGFYYFQIRNFSQCDCKYLSINRFYFHYSTRQS